MRRERALKVALVAVGLIFSAGIYPVTESLWHQNQSMYTFDMMLSLYVALGIFLLIAVRNPSAHRSLIAFTAWSCFAHAAVMAFLRDSGALLHPCPLKIDTPSGTGPRSALSKAATQGSSTWAWMNTKA
jgi:hypothetical protein